MKRIVIYCLPLMILFSCARELNHVDVDLTEGDRYELSISGEIDQVFATRANDSGFCNGDAIGMYMVNCESGSSNLLKSEGNQADNVKFTYEEARNKWTPAFPVYYKDARTHVNIYGYYPYDASVADVASYSFEVQQNQRIDGRNGNLGGYEASDFLWGKAEDIVPSSNIVDIVFRHRMSSVRVTLTKGDGWESDAEWQSASKDVLITNIIRKSSINLEDGSVTTVGEVPNLGIVPAENGVGNWRAIVVPQEVSAGKVLMTITVNGEARDFVKDASYIYYSGKMNIVTLAVNKDASTAGSGLSIVSEGVVAWENDSISHDEATREYIVIKCAEPGRLSEVIESEGYDLTKIRNMKVEGRINASDFFMMRDDMTMLESINLSEVKIEKQELFGYEEDVIPVGAFYEKRSLKRFVFPRGIKGIESGAFQSTSLSGSLSFPEGLEFIEHYAFSSLEGLNGTLELPSTLKKLADGVFYCTNLRGNLLIPDSVSYIGYGAFSHTSFSGQLILPSSLEYLGSDAFLYCRNLSGDLVIPDKLKVLSFRCFEGCGFDGRLTLGKSLTAIEGDVFWGSFSGSLIIPEGVVSIGAGAFRACGFSSISLPESLLSIGTDAFSGCTEIKGEIDIPSGVEVLGARAFRDCNNIEKVTIPQNLNYIGSDAFADMYGLTSIICSSIEPPVLADNVFAGVPKDNFAVEVPEISVKDYQNAPGWNEFKRIVAHRDFSISRRLFRSLNAGTDKTFTLRAESNASWKVENKPDWVNVSPMSGVGKSEIVVSVSAFGEGAGMRTGEIVYKLDGKDYTVSTTVEQYGYQYADGDVYVVQNHTKGSGVDLVFMADGYDAKDISEGMYLSNSLDAVEHYFAIEPYRTYRDYFNVYVVFGCSADSGMGDENIIRESKFGSQYNGASDVEPDYETCFEYASKAPITDLSKILIVIVQNSNNYSGITYMYDDGSAISLCPMSTREYPFDFRGLVQHEAGGHGFGKLGDEYIYYNTFLQGTAYYSGFVKAKLNGWFDNLSLQGDLQKVPWSHLIFDEKYSDIVDVYEGGYFFTRGVYRSEANSCMNNNVPYFSSVSRESIVRRIMQYAGEEYDFESFKALDVIDRSQLDVSSTKSTGYWYVPQYGHAGHREPVFKGASPKGSNKR